MIDNQLSRNVLLFSCNRIGQLCHWERFYLTCSRGTRPKWASFCTQTSHKPVEKNANHPPPPTQMYSLQENFTEIPRSTTHLHFLQNDFTILRGLQETSPPKSSLANAQKKSYKKRGEKVAGRRVSKRLMSRGKRRLKTQKLSKSCLPLWLWKKFIIPALMLSFNQYS